MRMVCPDCGSVAIGMGDFTARLHSRFATGHVVGFPPLSFPYGTLTGRWWAEWFRFSLL